MAVTMAEITKLRKISGAGMMDCKNALTEANGDIDKAMEIIRKKGQAVAAKRSDREASEGCVLAKKDGEFAAIIALKCETDFVAKNADFVALTQAILDAAVANRCKTLEEVKALPMGNGTVQDAVTDRSGITGEKMELDGYNVVEGAYTSIYNHQGNNQLCTIVAMNKEAEAAAHGVAMQIAAMNPIAIDEAGVPESVKEAEIQVAIDKTKKEQVDKAVEVALKKAGINPAHVDSEEHMESNKAKGWITDEDIAKAKEIIATVSAEKAANLPQQMIENIAKGRLGKFLKEVCLLNQEDIMDGKKTVREVLKEADPELQTRCLNSPWIRISPSFTEPPTPHLLFNNLPNSFRSFSVPMNPLINVTVLPPRPFFSILTRSFCCFLSNVSTASSSTLSYLKSGFVE